MIGSFWNLCRACPSMPVDKLHSEYRSTYRWHEFTGNSRPEIVRRPPLPNQFGPINEPPLPRRKKCPELAYKSHEFIIGSENLVSNLRNGKNSVTRARSEERCISSRRSKSEGPPDIANGSAFPISFENEVNGKANGIDPVEAGESNGLFKKTISKLSTEYRLQFVWPHVRKAIKRETNDKVEFSRKSLMGPMKSSDTHLIPTVHKKRTTKETEATIYELEPLVNDEKKIFAKNLFGPEENSNQGLQKDKQVQFSTKKENFGFKNEKFAEEISETMPIINNNTNLYGDQWYKDVIELRKKAGEYKCRGWGTEIDPELYKKQKELWDQVSRRSSLSALSLASSLHRPITKEEKEKQNTKKSSPIKSLVRGKDIGQFNVIDNKILPDGTQVTRAQTIRHHLERTTGPDVEEGALLPSPTREKLMPAIPKSKEVEPFSSQRGSPKKSAASRHGSPQKGSPQKGSPKKVVKGRSHSVGLSVVENESPKRQLRSISTAPVCAKSNKKTPPTVPERRKRPYEEESQNKDNMITAASISPQISQDVFEHIVKSPPEPTRVKSPEQIIMRSPDPVNWTVPLDTGKTFTVTQNVKEGEMFSRPQSEVKASTPIERPPPAPLSAPPELAEQAKMGAWKCSDESEMIVVPNHDYQNTSSAGSTLRSLEDPLDDSESTTRKASDVLEKARDRFDRFWGGNKEENV